MAYRKGLFLTFDMVNVIVSADNLKESESSLTSVCCGPGGSHAPTQVAQKLYCSTCDTTVTYGEIKKAQKVGDQFVVVEQQEVATARDSVMGATKKMMTVTMHPASDVTTQMLPDKSVYLLTPEGAPQIGAYSLMLDTIERHPDVAFLVRWTPSSRVNTYRLEVFGGALVMQQLCSPEQVRAVPSINVIEALPEHQAMMDTIVPARTTAFDPAAYNNQAAAAMAELIASKEAVDGVSLDKPKAGPKAPGTTGGVDLTAALAAMMGQVTPAPAKKAAPRKRVKASA